MNIIDFQPVIWNVLLKSIHLNKLSNAYLFYGPEGCGKEWTALEFARILNCFNKESTTCHSCESCIKFKSLQHPNLFMTFPLPASKKENKKKDSIGNLSQDNYEILLDSLNRKSDNPFYKINISGAQRILLSSIKDIKKNSFLKLEDSSKKVFTIFDAHLLSVGSGESANSLLKILEEPPENSLFILTTDFKNKLLPTILSRCQKYYFSDIDILNVQLFLEKQGVDKEKAKEIATFSFGNIQFASKLINIPNTSIFRKTQKFVEQIVVFKRDNWELFIKEFSMLAYRNPDEYNLNFQLAQAWFNHAMKIRSGYESQSLGFKKIENKIKEFNKNYPNANLFEINNLIEHTLGALKLNLDINLTLINFLMSMQTLLKGKKIKKAI